MIQVWGNFCFPHSADQVSNQFIYKTDAAQEAALPSGMQPLVNPTGVQNILKVAVFCITAEHYGKTFTPCKDRKGFPVFGHSYGSSELRFVLVGFSFSW